MVIVKVGKPTERSKPGNRGKRDSQILLMHYLNRVHFDAPMSPLELEIYHQMRNVIGIDPAFYEYIFTVDADTVGFYIRFCAYTCLKPCFRRSILTP
jgi:chitin synthase